MLKIIVNAKLSKYDLEYGLEKYPNYFINLLLSSAINCKFDYFILILSSITKILEQNKLVLCINELKEKINNYFKNKCFFTWIMEKLITIINPIGGTFATRRGGKSHSTKKVNNMAAKKRRKSRKRKTAKRRTYRRKNQNTQKKD